MNQLGSLEGCLWNVNSAIRVRAPGEGEGNDPNFLRLFFGKLSKKKKLEFYNAYYSFQFSQEVKSK